MNIKKLIVLLALGLTPLTALAAPVPWDFSAGTNILQPTQSAMTAQVKVPYLTATSTTATSTLPFLSSTIIEAITLCLTGDTCRTTWPTSSGSGNVATSTTETAGNLAYWTSTGATPATLGKVATTTLTATTPVSVSNSPVVIGATPAVITIADAAADASTKGAATFTAADFNSSSGNISIDYANGQEASGSVDGFVGTGAQTFAGAKTFTSDPIISKADPVLSLTDTTASSDDYTLDVGAAGDGRFRIRNSTRGLTAFESAFNGTTGRQTAVISTNYAPANAAANKLLIQDRQTTSTTTPAAVLSSSMEILASGAWTASSNQSGYDGGVSVFSLNGAVSNIGAFGLRGNAAALLYNGNAISGITGLFGGINTSNGGGGGGVLAAANAILSFISVGSQATTTEAVHVKIGATGSNSSITTLKGLDVPDFTSVANVVNRFEIWMAAAAGIFFRDALTEISSPSTNTLQFAVAGTATTTLTTTGFTIGTAGDGVRMYTQIDSEAGAPAAGDCDANSESGRMIIDHTNDLLYVCNQLSGLGWDTVALTP